MEITTIGFANNHFPTVSRRRASAPQPDVVPSEVKVNVSSTGSTERQRAFSLGRMLVLTVSIEPPESHPVDRLLPQSRLQQMKKLLERAAVAYPNRTKGAR